MTKAMSMSRRETLNKTRTQNVDGIDDENVSIPDVRRKDADEVAVSLSQRGSKTATAKDSNSK